MVSTSAETEGIYNYSVSDGVATITSYSGTVPSKITIPSTLGGYPVTAIGDYAFYHCESLRGVIIPDTVTSIGNATFDSCSNLWDVTIGSRVTTIGDKAFFGCSLRYITIPDSVTTIGSSTFAGHYADTIEIGKGVLQIGDSAFKMRTNGLSASVYIKDLKSWTNIDFASADSNPIYGSPYDNPMGTLYLDGKAITELVIPDGVTEIKPYAFTHSNVNTVKLPDSVTKIGKGAFAQCENLKTIELSDELTNIGDSALGSCINLIEIKFPTKLINVGAYAFSNCSTLTELTFPDGLESIGDGAIQNCANLKAITLPNSLKSIGKSLCGVYSNLWTNLETVNYNGDIYAWQKISRGGDNNHFNSVPKNYYWYVTYINESGEIIQKDKISPNSKVKLADFSPKEDYVTEHYADEALTTVFDSTKPINKNTDIYTKVYLPLLNEIQIDGNVDWAEVGTEGLTCSVNFATDKESTALFLYIKYPAGLVLSDVNAKEFAYVETEDVYTEAGYTTATILAQYSDSDQIPQYDVLTPFELVFDVSEDACVGDAVIEIIEDSFLSGNEIFGFDNRIFTRLEIVPKLVKSIEITGEDSISSPSQYVVTVSPDDAFEKNVNWSVDNEAIAIVDEFGIVTPVTSGTIVLTAAAKDRSGVRATKTIEIVKHAESIEIIGDEAISEPSQYSAVIFPEYTTNKNAKWSISDETIATVDENGVVTPLKNGKIVLTAKAEDASGIETTKSIVITVSVRANSITSDVGTWDKEFDSDITEYTINVPAGTTTIYLTSSFENATAKVNGSIAANGIRKKVTLTGDETNVEILLTPTSGNYLTANTYTIKIVRGSFTKTSISDDGKSFTVVPVNIENGKTVILALYNREQFVEMQKAVYVGDAIPFTTDKTYTDAKVMVWDDLANLKPVCDVEIVK
jgi:hypothetical protein